jgi:hypothetical protein
MLPQSQRPLAESLYHLVPSHRSPNIVAPRTPNLSPAPPPSGDVTEEEEFEGHPVVTPPRGVQATSSEAAKTRSGASFSYPTPHHASSSKIRSLGSTPTRRIVRSQSTHTARPQQPLSDRILRSHSQRVNPKSSTIMAPLPHLASFLTPKRKVRSTQVQPSRMASPSCPLAESSASDTPSPTRRVIRREYRRDSSVEREVGMVKGLQNVNIPPIDSDD